ncbi:MAG: HRDC domain-containing protein [Dehalococcoidales bacterium]|nr:HRDC domain-containing protein [Dehalococcoidales bacterium]
MPNSEMSVEMISTPDRLKDMVAEMLSSDVISLDTESNSRHRYPEQLCLVQIATATGIYIIDTIRINDISTLGSILANPAQVKVIHDASYDVRCLDRHQGLHFSGIFDTSIAARFLGFSQISLAAIIESTVGKKIAKSTRLQQSDWGKRPLTTEALEYASGDVRYLIQIREILERKLKTLGRLDWVMEEFGRLEEVRYVPPDKENEYQYLKGTRDLDGRALSILKSLYWFREETALRERRPPYFILPDEYLINLASHPGQDLSNVFGLSEFRKRTMGRGLLEAIRKGEKGAPIEINRQNNFERPTMQQIARLGSLKSWRVSLGAKLNIDPALIWPRESLEAIAKDPGEFEANLNSEIVRRWQREEFGSTLANYVRSIY